MCIYIYTSTQNKDFYIFCRHQVKNIRAGCSLRLITSAQCSQIAAIVRRSKDCVALSVCAKGPGSGEPIFSSLFFSTGSHDKSTSSPKIISIFTKTPQCLALCLQQPFAKNRGLQLHNGTQQLASSQSNRLLSPTSTRFHHSAASEQKNKVPRFSATFVASERRQAKGFFLFFCIMRDL